MPSDLPNRLHSKHRFSRTGRTGEEYAFPEEELFHDVVNECFPRRGFHESGLRHLTRISLKLAQSMRRRGLPNLKKSALFRLESGDEGAKPSDLRLFRHGKKFVFLERRDLDGADFGFRPLQGLS